MMTKKIRTLIKCFTMMCIAGLFVATGLSLTGSGLIPTAHAGSNKNCKRVCNVKCARHWRRKKRRQCRADCYRVCDNIFKMSRQSPLQSTMKIGAKFYRPSPFARCEARCYHARNRCLKKHDEMYCGPRYERCKNRCYRRY